MAIQEFVNGKLRTLTATQIKNRIMDNLGLDPADPADVRAYQRQYDQFRNRVRNYEQTIGSDRGEISAIDEFYRTTRRKAQGYNLTAQEQAILATPSSSPASFARTLGRGRRGYEAAQTRGIEQLTGVTADGEIAGAGVFRNLLEKSPTAAAEFKNFIEEAKAEGRTPSAAEVKEFLTQQSRDLKARKSAEYALHRAKYKSYRNVKSD